MSVDLAEARRLASEVATRRCTCEAGDTKWQDGSKPCAACQACFLLRSLVDEVERLRAIEAKLPKTADGVAVVPGMLVYGQDVQPLDGDMWDVFEIGRVGGNSGWDWKAVSAFGPLYSTREAAMNGATQ